MTTDYKVTDTELTAVADAIRTKGGTQAQLEWSSGFVSAIGDIETGITPTGNINITNMQSTDVAAYATAQVVDANLIAENIKKDVTILGVTGTYEGGGSVTIVPWSTGTDEEIVAMIQAAHNGDIDLQTDGGWSVGDVRSITVGSSTIDIAISSFADYNSCGCVMQFDFVDEYGEAQMNSSNTSVGGYGSSAMKTTTLPSIVNSLPTWLKDSLIEFSCLASAGNESSSIVTVTGNKLALRSEVEVTGSHSESFNGEGSQIPYYSTAANRIKKLWHGGSARTWWLRSPNDAYSGRFCCVEASGSVGKTGASVSVGVAPFGCL